MKRSVRRVGWIGTIAGLCAVVCGIGAGFAPLAAIGLVLVCADVWNVRRPSVVGLIVDGVAVILTGAFNFLVWVWIDHARASSVGKWFIAGLVQVVWGIRRLSLYRTARCTPDDLQAIARLESMVRELSRRTADDDSTVAEVWTGSLLRRRNRLGLYADGAIALLEQQAVRLEKRADIWIEACGTTSLGRSTKVAIQLGDVHNALRAL